jgi:hypothetical protein
VGEPFSDGVKFETTVGKHSVVAKSDTYAACVAIECDQAC